MSNVGSDPPTLAGILTGGSLGKKLPAGLIGGTISDTYLPILTDATNPWVSLFKSIEATYAPSLPWDGNVEYGMSEAYTFVQALKAAGQNPNSREHRRRRSEQPLDGRPRAHAICVFID